MGNISAWSVAVRVILSMSAGPPLGGYLVREGCQLREGVVLASLQDDAATCRRGDHLDAAHFIGGTNGFSEGCRSP
jgi:hypothetical protein